MDMDTLLAISSGLGLAALGVLLVSSMTGIARSTKAIRKLPFVNRITFRHHRWISLIGLGLIVFHPVPLPWTTSRSGIRTYHLFIPFIAPKENLLIGLGILAAYLLLLIIIVSMLVNPRRKTIAQFLHYGAYLFLALGLVHGLFVTTTFKSDWVIDYFDGEKMFIIVLMGITVLLAGWRIYGVVFRTEKGGVAAKKESRSNSAGESPALRG